jgi:hypothetical protein
MDAQNIDALNGLLEDERASVEILVALTAMATDALERQALTVMGGQAVQACFDLRERLERLGAPITERVGPALGRVSALEHLDERYRAFADLARQLAVRLQQLLEADLDPESQMLLAPLRALEVAQASWASQRADEFAASREIEAGPVARWDDHHVDERPQMPSERVSPPPAERPPQSEPDRALNQDSGATPGSQAEIEALVEPLQPTGTDVDGEPRPAPRARRSRARWSADDLHQHDGNES